MAQCPADPSTTIAGRWTFQTGTLIGQIIVTPGTGRLRVITTNVVGGNLQEYDQGAGTYQLNADCSGGVIFLNIDGTPIQWSFTITNNATFGRVINLFTSEIVRTAPGVYGLAGAGTAWPAPTGCPASAAGNPLNLLSGSYNTVSLSGVTVSGGVGSSLRGSILITAPGKLTAFLTPTYPPAPPFPTSNPPTQLLPAVSIGGDSGAYSVDGDCQRARAAIYYAWPRSMCYILYPRISTAGVISFVTTGLNLVGDPLTSTGAIAQ